MTGQLTIDAAGPEPAPELAQWFTPPALAHELVAMVADARGTRGDAEGMRILEPSAGRGSLVLSALTAFDGATIDAVELDPRWEDYLREMSLRVTVDIVDYLARPAPAERYDLAITNPPYDGGEEGAHLAKLLDEADRIAALLPARSLHGRDRYERVWRRFDGRRGGRDWYIRQRLHCIGRPRFGERGGTDEIVLLDLSREPGPCSEGWV